MRDYGKYCFSYYTKMVAALSLLALVTLNAQQTSGPLVTLPAFHVVDTRILPDPEVWNYAQVSGFEILSSASGSRSREVAQDFLRFHRAVAAVWPLERMNASVDASIVLCTSGKELKAFVPKDIITNANQTLSLSLEDHEHAAIVINLNAIDGDNQSSSKLLHTEYIHFIVNRIGPRAPLWLKSGLEATLESLVYTENQCAIRAQQDLLIEERKAFSNRLSDAVSRGKQVNDFANEDTRYRELLKQAGVITLKDLFVTNDDASAKESLLSSEPYVKQSQAFITFCLLSNKGKYRDAFTQFAYLSARLPQTEALFENCFHMGYDAMMALFWANTENLSNRGFDIIGKDGKLVSEMSKLEFKPATDAQSSRIRADAQRMAGRTEDGRYSLIAAYMRGQRDPDLLAALGLAEYAAGKEDRAYQFLEAAIQTNTKAPRAYVTHVIIQLKKIIPPDTNKKLTVNQVAGMLKLLFKAKALMPPLQEVYEQIAQVWMNSLVNPMQGHLQILNQGLVLFPYDTELFCLDAKLYSRIGMKSEALHILDLGYSLNIDPAERLKLIQLKASLDTKVR